MTAPSTASTEFGPGVLNIGATGSSLDVSCLVNNLQVSVAANRGDTKRMLCGTTKTGETTYDYELSGNLDLDLEAGAAGLFALSQAEAGSEQPFTFTPNTANGTSVEGTLILDPMSFGSTDGYGAIMNSDVSWLIVGTPEYTYGA